MVTEKIKSGAVTVQCFRVVTMRFASKRGASSVAGITQQLVGGEDAVQAFMR